MKKIVTQTFTAFNEYGFELLVTANITHHGYDTADEIDVTHVEFVIGGEAVNITRSLNERQLEFIIGQIDPDDINNSLY
jgi:hypothetical protein